MLKFSEINESALPSHRTVLGAISKAFESQKSGDANFETVHLHKNAHTGSTKHQVGSVKAHSLAYRTKRDAPDAYTGKQPYDSNKKYAKHPMHEQISKLANKFNGSVRDGHLTVKTTEGITHHVSLTSGSNYSTWDHSHN